jgi:hypothetical protein
MLPRTDYLRQLEAAVRRSPVTALLGPRQCGKTTLARALGEGRRSVLFDLESEPDRRRLDNPQTSLGVLEGLVIIDEIQRMPQLFSVLRVLVDRPDCRARFLILGSASPDVVKGVSESLAGRVELVELQPFHIGETGRETMSRLWLRGGFPRSYLAESDEDSFVWRDNFIRTFLELDIPQLGISIPAAAMRRFWTMLAHYHGNTWNGSELARSMAVSDKTVRSYLDILTGTFMVRQLQPWFENVGKRQVKSPKIYLRDSGLLHALLGLPDHHSLTGHPVVGASWEGFALEQALRCFKPAASYFWGTHGGAEVDLFFTNRGRRYAFEIKLSEAPKVTRSMHTARETLGLDHLWILYPGERMYLADEGITACPVADLPRLASEMS